MTSDTTSQYVTLELLIMLLKDIISAVHSGYDGTFMILACLKYRPQNDLFNKC